MKGLAFVTYVCAVATLIIVAEFAFLGQPPKHCRYFVPVVAHPGIYSCSEHPRPVKVTP